ncbi:MAG: amidohydrolase family protein [Saprospiraceae bacterium]
MKIDAHQHFWQYDPVAYQWISDAMPMLKQDRLPEDLLPLLHAQGFDGCVAVQARQSEAETDFLLQLAAQHKEIKAVVGWVDLQGADLELRLQHYRQFPLLKGFRHIVQDEPDDHFLLRDAFIRGVALLHAFGFTYDILVYEKHLPTVIKFLEHFDNQPFVLDHIGKPDIKEPMKPSWRDAIFTLATYPNLYCKISGLVTEAHWQHWQVADFQPFLEVVFEAFGADRLMIGSDWPVCLLAAPDYDAVIHLVENFTKDLSPADQAKVFGNNAAQFYNIQ